MIKPLIHNGRTLGETFAAGNIRFVFGSAALTRDALTREFPNIQFAFLKQVHGPAVVTAAPTSTPEADGHFTDQKNVGLVIQTADCAPILIANDQQICALHAGWRGAAKDIVKSAAPLFSRPPDYALIGPHIQFSSFEIGREVAELLLKAAPDQCDTNALLKAHPDPQKYYFDLAGLLTAQLLSVFPEVRIIHSAANTLIDGNYHSFRRNGPNAGRQFSFVVKMR